MSVKLALTAEEWQRVKSETEDWSLGARFDLVLSEMGFMSLTQNFNGTGSRDCKVIAALALHGQPFGFTWDDVDVLEGLARYVESLHIKSVADRIAALLPPRELAR